MWHIFSTKFRAHSSSYNQLFQKWNSLIYSEVIAFFRFSSNNTIHKSYSDPWRAHKMNSFHFNNEWLCSLGCIFFFSVSKSLNESISVTSEYFTFENFATISSISFLLWFTPNSLNAIYYRWINDRTNKVKTTVRHVRIRKGYVTTRISNTCMEWCWGSFWYGES